MIWKSNFPLSSAWGVAVRAVDQSDGHVEFGRSRARPSHRVHAVWQRNRRKPSNADQHSQCSRKGVQMYRRLLWRGVGGGSRLHWEPAQIPSQVSAGRSYAHYSSTWLQVTICYFKTTFDRGRSAQSQMVQKVRPGRRVRTTRSRRHNSIAQHDNAIQQLNIYLSASRISLSPSRLNNLLLLDKLTFLCVLLAPSVTSHFFFLKIIFKHINISQRAVWILLERFFTCLSLNRSISWPTWLSTRLGHLGLVSSQLFQHVQNYW